MNASKPIPARMKGLNRAEICDVNFVEFVRDWNGRAEPAPAPHEAILDGSALDARGFRDLFESQLVSRHLDLMARVLRVQNKVFYTIGSSGHEGNAMVARLTRHTDPAFLHYRSGGFMAERFRKLPGMDPIMDSALSFAASADDPASGGRHKVWGSKPLWVLPQTSTIASHLPKAFGTAIAIEQGPRVGHALPIPDDSIVVCSFGDASSNHATAQTAFNAAAWTAYQKLPAPVLFVCEDNGIGISVKTPTDWVAQNFKDRATSIISTPTASISPTATATCRPRSNTAAARVARRSCTCARRGSWATPAPISKSNGVPSKSCARWRRPIRCCVRPAIALESG
jgi:2-oxoisovalerate dehydrogenase E1 component